MVEIIPLAPNRVWRTYSGGKQLDILAGESLPEDGHFPEDWIGSVTEAKNPGREDIAEGVSPVQIGDELMARMESYNYLGTWGALLAETSRGRMQRLPGSQRAVMRYSLNRADVTRLQRYLALIGELYFEAGARRLYPAVRGWGVLRDRVDLAHFASARLDAADLLISAYHPTGTCIMGRDPASSLRLSVSTSQT